MGELLLDSYTWTMEEPENQATNPEVCGQLNHSHSSVL